MKKVNGITVYEELDKCSLDEYSQSLANDIPKAIDKNTEGLKTDLQTIKQEQQDQNSKIESNTTENKDNAELLSQIMGLLPSTKGEEEHVTLDNTAEARFKNFQVHGNSKQETRSGKNKFDGNFSQGYDSSGKITSSSQFICNTNLINVIQNKTYTISNNLNLKIASIAYYKDNEFVNFKSNIASNTINIPENVNQIRFNLYREQGLSVSEINMCQLEEGEIATDYEPYGASPSPEFPSVIRNTGDNINLYNKDNANILNTMIDTRGLGVNAGDTYKTIYIPCKPNTTYTVSKLYDATKNRFALGFTDTEPTYSMKVEGYITNANVSDLTITTGANAKYLLAYIWITGGTTTYKEMLDSIKIEEGPQATAYSPYNCGNAEITVGNKNLANTKIIKNTNIITVNEDGSITLANNSNTAGYASTGKKLNELCKGLKVGDTAYLKLITTSTNNIYLQGKANQYWLGNNSNKITKDMLEDTVIVYGGYNKTDKLQIQITKNTIGDYAQNKQQTIVFPFTEGQRLYKGDYLAENGIHHARKQIVLDETEGWQLGGSGNNLINQRFYLANNDIKPNGAILCNYFKEMYRGNIQITVEDIEACNISNGKYIQIKINKKIASTVDEFKNWIKQKKNEGNPITLECEVESEIIEPYTQEQQEVYNKLKKLYSYNEQTNIFSTNEIGPIFNVEAIKNLNATFAQLSATMLERS